MAKQIKVEVLEVAGFNKVLVKIVDQTNRGAAFGNIEGDKAWKSKNGVKLVSNRFPARDKDKTLPAAKTFYVRGSETAKDDASFAVSAKKLPKLIEAIKEYNFYYSTAQINARVRAKRAAEELAERQAEVRRQNELAAQRRREATYYAPRPVAQDACSYIVG